MKVGDPPAARPHSAPPQPPDEVAALLRERLAERWPVSGDRLGELCRYALLPTGKLLRPLLLVHSARAAGTDLADVLPAALAVEYLHVASLVHDDVIDGDQLRRGRPSIAAGYGTDSAIVTGDALIFAVFEALADCADSGVPAVAVVAAMRAFARAGTDLCRGQALEEDLSGDPRCPVDRYLAMAALKTSALFRGACEAGALLAGAPDDRVRALAAFAKHLGIAFQIHDDLLSYGPGAAATGKAITSDAANRRPTLPVLLGYQSGGRTERRAIEAALSGRLPPAEAHRTLSDVLGSTGALRAASDQATAQVTAARRELAALPPNDGTTALGQLADLAIGTPTTTAPGTSNGTTSGAPNGTGTATRPAQAAATRPAQATAPGTAQATAKATAPGTEPGR